MCFNGELGFSRVKKIGWVFFIGRCEKKKKACGGGGGGGVATTWEYSNDSFLKFCF